MKIELRGVLKSYRSVRALDHVSLQLDSGQIVSLLGPNGAGKTTLIRCLAGIAAPDKGGIYFDDQEFQRDRLDLRSRIYLMPDFPFLFWEHSILRNIAIILRLYEKPIWRRRGKAWCWNCCVISGPCFHWRCDPSIPSPGARYTRPDWWRCWRLTVIFGCWMNLLPRAWIRRELMRSSAMPVKPPAAGGRSCIRHKSSMWPNDFRSGYA